jgi:predicted nuclease of restriction endonuclease-like (RecB) superfamily
MVQIIFSKEYLIKVTRKKFSLFQYGQMKTIKQSIKFLSLEIYSLQLSDLQQEFPGTTGFSARNLWDMKKFFEFYKDVDVKLRQLVALLPWKHNLLIMSKSSSIDEAKYYAEQ